MNIFISIVKKCITTFYDVRFILRKNRISKGVEIGKNVHLRKCIIGKYCYIGSNSIINHAEIHAYCSVAPGVQIGGMEHSTWQASTNTHLSEECIFGNTTYIGPDVWIAAGSIIKQGVTIGQGAVVGANSFVNKDIPPYAIVVGSPARILKYRFNDDIIQRLIESEYWKLSPTNAKKVLESIVK